jgi:hypothetical protein
VSTVAIFRRTAPAAGGEEPAEPLEPLPGVDVIITIFSDFLFNFRRKKLEFFVKTNVKIDFLAKTSSSLSKNATIFANFLIFMKS